VPLVLRASAGVLRSSAAHHSSSLEAIFAHMPGLTVAAPPNPADAKELLRTAIDVGNPAAHLENKRITAKRRHSARRRPSRSPRECRGSAAGHRRHTRRLLHHGRHGAKACDILSGRSMSVEAHRSPVAGAARLRHGGAVPDPYRSGRRDARAWRSEDFGAEAAARLAEEPWGEPQAPVLRVGGAASTSVPFSPVLEAAVVPGIDGLVVTVER